MGVRLIKYGVNSGAGTYNHDELKNRDLPDQHPIEAITGLVEALEAIDVKIEDVTGINAVIDTQSIHFDYNATTKALTGNVKIFSSEDNALVEKTSGLYVDKYLDIEIEDTTTIDLSVEGLGETLKTMYNTGTRFSHYGTWSNLYTPAEANAWYYSDALGSFVQPQNTTTFTGFISTVKYRTYTHRATLKSTDSDNDGIGVVIAYAVDSNGYPHTLSLVINKGGETHVGAYYYALVYDKNLPDQQILFTKGNKTGGTIPGNHSTSGWSGQTITVEINKSGSIVTCAASNYGSTTINLATLIEIDLDDYSWGSLFRGKVQYGYCAQSQPSSYFQNIYFNGKGPLKANVILSSQADNALQIVSDGLYLSGKNIKGGGSSEFDVNKTKHGFTVGMALYYNAVTGYEKGIANESAMSEIIGVVSEVTDVDNFRLCTSGFFETTAFNTYANGTVLFLSSNTQGALTDTEPETVSKPIATKIANGLVVNIQRGILNNNGETITEEVPVYKIDDRVGDFKYSNDTTTIRTDGYILFQDSIPYVKTQIQELLTTAAPDFLVRYTKDKGDGTIEFINTEEIVQSIKYEDNLLRVNLYIKGFSTDTSVLTQVPIGHIIMLPANAAPVYYLPMIGQILNINQYPNLASYMYNTYGSYNTFGGDGILTFGLPDLSNAKLTNSTTTIDVYYFIKYA